MGILVSRARRASSAEAETRRNPPATSSHLADPGQADQVQEPIETKSAPVHSDAFQKRARSAQPAAPAMDDLESRDPVETVSASEILERSDAVISRYAPPSVLPQDGLQCVSNDITEFVQELDRTQSEKAIMMSALLEADVTEHGKSVVEVRSDSAPRLDPTPCMDESASFPMAPAETAACKAADGQPEEEEEEEEEEEAAAEEELGNNIPAGELGGINLVDLDEACRIASVFERTASKWVADQHADFIVPERTTREPAKDAIIVRGDLRMRYKDGSDLCEYLAHIQSPKLIRAAMSSTFSAVELDTLCTEVVTPMQDLARTHGHEIVLVHSYNEAQRWVARSGSRHSVDELQWCQSVSAGLTLVFLSCNQYGALKPPCRIPEAKLDALLQSVDDDQRALLSKAYKLDTNSIILPMEFRSSAPDSGPTQSTLQEWFGTDGPQYYLDADGDDLRSVRAALVCAAKKLWPQVFSSNLRAASSSHFCKKLFIGEEEELVSLAAFWPRRDRGQGMQHVVVLERVFAHVPVPDEAAPAFTDVVEGKVEAEAQELLIGQRQLLQDQFNADTAESVKIEWVAGKGLDLKDVGHRHHLNLMCAKLRRALTENLREAMAREPVEDACLAEVQQHMAFAMHRARSYQVGQECVDPLFRLKSYIAHNSSSKALVLTGRPGSGKTSMLCKIAHDAATEASQQGRICIARFVGSSTAARSVHSLLYGVVCQMSRAFRRSVEIPHAFHDLVSLFKQAVQTWPNAFARLTLILDGVDELDGANLAHQLDWLPVTEIPSSVAVIVSVSSSALPDPTDKFSKCLDVLKQRIARQNLTEAGGWKAVASLVRRKSLLIKAAADSVVEEPKPPSDTDDSFVTISPPGAARDRLEHLLRMRGRVVTAEQLDHLEESFRAQRRKDTAGSSLWLWLAAQQACQWRSYHIPGQMAPTVTGQILNRLDVCKNQLGEQLVRKALAALTICKNGVSEVELCHVLSLDDDVLVEGLGVWWSKSATRAACNVPSGVVARLLQEMRDVLLWRDRSGVLAWVHAEIHSAVSIWVFDDRPEYRTKAHTDCAEYFSGVHAGVVKPFGEALRVALGDDRGAERGVPRQPLVFHGDVFDPRSSSDGLILNRRRMAEYVHHCIRAGLASQLCTELSSVLYIAAKLWAGAGAELHAELSEAAVEHRVLHQVLLFVERSMQDCAGLPWAILQAALNEPDESPVCISAISGGFAYGMYAVRWLRKPQCFDPCLSVWRETHTVLCLACCPVGEWVAYGVINGTIKVCGAATSELVSTLSGHTHTVSALAFSGGRERIVSGSYDQSVRQWDCRTGRQIGRPLQGHTSKITAVVYSPDGKLIASASHDHTIRLWNATSGSPVGTPLEKMDSPVNAVDFSPGGHVLVSGAVDRSVRMWDFTTRKQIGRAMRHADEVTCVCFSPDGTRIASGSTDKTVRQWDVATQEELGTALEGHEDVVCGLAWSPDGFRIVSAGGGKDRSVCLWDARRFVQRGAPWRGHVSAVNAVAFTADGTTVFSAGSDKCLRRWDVAIGAALKPQHVGHRRGVNCVAFSPDGSKAISGSLDKTLLLWRPESGEECTSSLVGHTHVVRAVVWAGSDAGSVVVSGSMDRTLIRWEAESGAQIGGKMEGHTAAITCLCISPDQSTVLSASEDRSVRLWDAHSGECLGVLSGHREEVNDAAFSPCGTMVASAGMENIIRLWDVSDPAHPTCIAELSAHSKPVLSVAFSPCGTMLASGSRDGTVRRWDVEEREMVKGALMGHTEAVQRVSFCPDGTRIVSGSDTGVKQWDAKTGSSAGDGGMRGSLFAFDTSQPCLRFLVTAESTGSGAIRVYDVARSATLVALFLPHCPVVSLACRGQRICAGCTTGRVLHVDAPFMVAAQYSASL